jgi:uncharacterized integral membrane protein
MVEEQPSRFDTGDKIRIGLGVVLLVALVTFVLDNTDSVRVGFVFDDADVPLIWVLLVTTVIGVVLGRVWSWSRRR